MIFDKGRASLAASVLALVALLVVACASATRSATVSHSPAVTAQMVSVKATDFNVSLADCSPSGQISAVTKQLATMGLEAEGMGFVIDKDWHAAQASGATEGRIQTLSDTENTCKAWYLGGYNPNGRIVASVIVEFETTAAASDFFRSAAPLWPQGANLGTFGMFSGHALDGGVVGADTGFGANSIVAATQNATFLAIWQRGRFYIVFLSVGIDQGEARNAATRMRDRVPEE